MALGKLDSIIPQDANPSWTGVKIVTYGKYGSPHQWKGASRGHHVLSSFQRNPRRCEQPIAFHQGIRDSWSPEIALGPLRMDGDKIKLRRPAERLVEFHESRGRSFIFIPLIGLRTTQSCRRSPFFLVISILATSFGCMLADGCLPSHGPALPLVVSLLNWDFFIHNRDDYEMEELL